MTAKLKEMPKRILSREFKGFATLFLIQWLMFAGFYFFNKSLIGTRLSCSLAVLHILWIIEIKNSEVRSK